MKVCIIWTQSTYQNSWDYLLQAFRVSRDDVYVILRSEEAAPQMSKVIGSCNFMRDVEHLPPGPLVVCSPKNAQALPGKDCLHGFEHPENAIYVFGADNITLDRNVFEGRKIDHAIYIPTEGTNLHSHVAAAMVLYDRRHKEWLTQ